MTSFHIGTSGWSYDNWKGDFFPEDLPREKWPGYYACRFDTVELNSSFYRLPSPETYEHWAAVFPRGFKMAVKMSRFVTHRKKLHEASDAVANFIDRARLLDDRLGPVFLQLPGNWHMDVERLREFISALPGDIRYAFEFRHESWFDEQVYDLLRQHNIAFCLYDMPDLKPPPVVTANFGYMRFHGSPELYTSSYSDEDLRAWANELRTVYAAAKDVYIYFNNDAAGYAPHNALTLKKMLAEPRGMTGGTT